jgi:hypothetical protein
MLFSGLKRFEVLERPNMKTPDFLDVKGIAICSSCQERNFLRCGVSRYLLMQYVDSIGTACEHTMPNYVMRKSCLSGCCLDTDLRKRYLGSDLITCGRIPLKAPTDATPYSLVQRNQRFRKTCSVLPSTVLPKRWYLCDWLHSVSSCRWIAGHTLNWYTNASFHILSNSRSFIQPLNTTQSNTFWEFFYFFI